LSWDGSKWAPANVGYIPGSPPPGGFLGNVFYQDNAGNFTQEDAFRYTASTNTLAVENITGTTVTGSGVVKGSNTFGQRYATQAATNRAAANTASLTVERYFTVTAEGNGESFNIQTNTPSAGNKIVRKIWYKAEAFEDTDVNTWTLLHTFADNTAYASTATKWQEYLDGQTYGKPPFTLAISWEDVPLPTTLLATYSGATAGFSLRLIGDGNYTGSAIRVRRASDNTEQDIGFDANGDLDTSALTTFCTGTNGFIRTWYDQSGNTRNLVQTTTSRQFKIYDSSTGYLGKLTQIAGTANGLLFSSVTISQPFSVFAVADFGAATSNNTQPYLYDGTGASNRAITYLNGVSPTNTTGFFSGTEVTATPRLSAGNKVIAAIHNGASSTLHSNGASVISGNIGSDSWTFGTVGNRYILNQQNNITSLTEFVVWPSSQASNRAAIETHMNDYWNIY
jgi:hypothetical protein